MSEKIKETGAMPQEMSSWDNIGANKNFSQERKEQEKLFLDDKGIRKEEYVSSKAGQEEISIEDTFDQWVRELDEMVEEGKISKEEARRQQEELLESAVEGIYAVRGEEQDRMLQEKRKELVGAFQKILSGRAENEVPATSGEHITEAVAATHQSDAEVQPAEVEKPAKFVETDVMGMTDDELAAERAELMARKAKIEERISANETSFARPMADAEQPVAHELDVMNMTDDELAAEHAALVARKAEIESAHKPKERHKESQFRDYVLRYGSNGELVFDFDAADSAPESNVKKPVADGPKPQATERVVSAEDDLHSMTDDELAAEHAALVARKAEIENKKVRLVGDDVQAEDKMKATDEKIPEMTESSEQTKNSEFRNEIWRQAEGVDSTFASFIREPDQGSSSETSDRIVAYEKWWNNQNDDKRNQAAAVIKQMRNSSEWYSSNPSYGNSFVSWMQLNHMDILAS